MMKNIEKNISRENIITNNGAESPAAVDDISAGIINNSFSRSKIKNFYKRYERYLSPVALFAGFIVDNLTLRRIDLLVENIVLLVYLAIAGLSILAINFFEEKELKFNILKKIHGSLPLVLQFAFGGLFSVFTVFYTRSASVLASWPFLLFLFVLLVGNELFHKKYKRAVFQLSIYFITLFSYSVFALPILIGRMGSDIFILSGILSLGFLGLFAFLLFRINKEKFKIFQRTLIISVGSIYLAFNLMYFLNIIPPIPLSLKDNGIYHSVKRSGSGYEVSFEPARWYRFWENFDHTFHWQPGRPVYCYSAIFAPTKISTEIYHRWLFYSEAEKRWVEKDRLSYPIQGGRDGGYRGYSYKYGVEPGKWRVDVITERGQVIGRTNFKIVEGGAEIDLRVEKR